MNNIQLITRLQHVSLLVQDTQRALAFYVDLLGMQVDNQRPELGYPGAWLQVGNGLQIHLLELPNPDPIADRPAHGGRDRHVALLINSLDELQQRLTRAEIPFTLSKSGRQALFCRDPDANALEFIQAS